jgi:hypothetical protein
VILAIDASTTATGYAHGGAQDALPRGGVWKLPGADELVLGRTITMLGQSIMETARCVKPTVIYVEAPFAKIDREHSEQTAIALMQLAGGMRLVAGLLACRIELVAVYNVRKYFIGEGFLSREQAKARVMDRCNDLGWSYQDDNESDAKAVWAYGMSREVPGWRPNAPQLFDEGRKQA